MLTCTLPDDGECTALGSHCDCFPWCDYLKDIEDRESGLVENERCRRK